MKQAVSSPAVASCAGKLFVIGGGPDDDTCSDKVGNRCVSCSHHTFMHTPRIAEAGPPNLFSVITPQKDPQRPF